MLLKSILALAVAFLPLAQSLQIAHHTHNNASNASTAGLLACERPPQPGKITYRGGRIIKGTFNTYAIFYGQWKDSERGLLTNFLKNVGSSKYYAILKSYKVTGGSKFKGTFNIKSYTHGKTIPNSALPTIVSYAVSHGLPLDTNGIYFIFTDKNVRDTGGFCRRYCGYHDHASIKGKTLLYSFIGNPQHCIGGCSPCNINVSPNKNTGVDAMVSVTAHELVETASDPLLNAWLDNDGEENADKCAYNYGKTFKTPNGALANIKLGGKNYLVQRYWSAKTQSCALSA